MYALGCRYFVYDSEGQYELLQKLSPEAKKIVRLQLRFVSPHDLVYGLYPEEIADMARRGKLPDGYTFYIFERDNWVEKLNGVFDALEELMAAREDGSPLLLNLGGHYVLPSAETAAVFDTLRQRHSMRNRTPFSSSTAVPFSLFPSPSGEKQKRQPLWLPLLFFCRSLSGADFFISRPWL